MLPPQKGFIVYNRKIVIYSTRQLKVKSAVETSDPPKMTVTEPPARLGHFRRSLVETDFTLSVENCMTFYGTDPANVKS